MIDAFSNQGTSKFFDHYVPDTIIGTRITPVNKNDQIPPPGKLPRRFEGRGKANIKVNKEFQTMTKKQLRFTELSIFASPRFVFNLHCHQILKETLCSRECYTILNEKSKAGPQKLSNLYIISNGLCPTHP